MDPALPTTFTTEGGFARRLAPLAACRASSDAHVPGVRSAPQGARRWPKPPTTRAKPPSGLGAKPAIRC